MAKVTGIEPCGREGRLVRISMDERLVCTISQVAFKHFPLAVGMEVEQEAYLDQVAAWQVKGAYEKALSLLDVCDRTEKQVMERLARRGVLPRAAQAVIERLRGNHLLDDAAYAQRLVQLQSDKGAGRYALRRKLMAKGIGEEQAEQALSALDEAQQRDACRDMARKLARRYREDEARDARRKLAQALARRGFSWDQIAPAVDETLGEEEDWLDQ